MAWAPGLSAASAAPTLHSPSRSRITVEKLAPEPDSTKTAGRPKPSRQGYSSYAAISLLKDVTGKKQAESKQGSFDGAPAEEGPPKSPRGEVSLQRTAPSRENALLRAEIEVLKQQNNELSSKLAAAESRLGQHSRQLRHSHSGLQTELNSLKQALSSAGAEKASALSVAEQAFAQMESLGKTLEDLLLQPGEVETAAITCCILARYWELAEAYELYPEVASTNAAYWKAVAPPAPAVLESAQYQQQQQAAALKKGLDVGKSSPVAIASSSNASALNGGSCATSSRSSSPAGPAPAAEAQGPEWLRSASGRFSFCMQATAADLLEVERGLCQLQQLGVQRAVLAAMASQAHNKRATLQLSAADLDGCSTSQLFMVRLSPAEEEEVRFQTAHLAYTWGRAAQLGLEQHIAAERAEHWHSRLERQPCLKDLQDLRLAGQELSILGLDQQLWQVRYRGMKGQQ